MIAYYRDLLESALHIIPKGDAFCHTEASWCACKPRLEARAVSGIGAGAWFTHRLKDPVSFPEEWCCP